MRLKGQLRDPETFMRVLQSIARMSPRCVLRFSKNTVQIATPRSTDAVEAFASLDDINEVFKENAYRVESNFNDQINIELSPDALVSALRSADKTSNVVLKLGKANGRPMLLIVIGKENHSGHEIAISHEVYIDVKRPSDMKTIRTAEEALERFNYHVSAKLPELGEMRAVAERMRTIDTKNDRITIGINRIGEIRLGLRADEIDIKSTWTGLAVGKEAEALQDGASIPKDDPRRTFRSACIDLKAFVRFLSCPLVKYHGEAFIQNRHVATFILHVHRREEQNPEQWFGHLMINLPALSDGDDY